MPKVTKGFLRDSWLRRREIGNRSPLGERDAISRKLYANFKPCSIWCFDNDPMCYLKRSDHGGILTLDFSGDGSLLVAGSIKDSLLMFDPLSHNLVHSINKAHAAAVNCVKFLDSRIFATCSDDSTVALWDSRNLKSRVHTLRGHNSWVKNIEYSSVDGLLITSGFDGNIYSWDINSYSEKECEHKLVFGSDGLVRTGLTPDGSKLIISTRGGYLMVIHDLNLKTLAKDLSGFKPNIYRLMQLSRAPAVAKYGYLFSQHRKTNRVEFVSDFPPGDDAEVVSTLQIHPRGLCMISRNVSYDEKTEWTCVHDLQDRKYSCSEIECELDDAKEELAQTIGDNTNIVNSCLDLTGPQINFVPHSSRVPATQNSASTATPAASVSETSSSAVSNLSEDVLSAIHAIDSQRTYHSPMFSHRRVTVERRMNIGAPRHPLVNRYAIDGPLERIQIQLIPRLFSLPSSSSFIGSSFESDEDDGDFDDDDDYDDDDDGSYELFRQERIRLLRDRSPQSSVFNSTSSVNGEETDEYETNSSFVRPSTSQFAVPFLSTNERHIVETAAEGVYFRPSTSHHELLQSVNNLRVSSGAEGADGEQSPQLVQIRCVSFWGPNFRNNVARNSSGLSDSADIAQCTTSSSIHTTGGNHLNLPRLTHYIQEHSLGRGFVKGLGFSPDGRIICSPYGFGLRLLSFTPDCLDVPVPNSNQLPVKLHELTTHVGNKDFIITSKFSPRHCFLVSGCLNGKILWHQPYF